METLAGRKPAALEPLLWSGFGPELQAASNPALLPGQLAHDLCAQRPERLGN